MTMTEDKRGQKEISPGLNQLLNLGPAALFFALVVLWRDDSFTIWGREYSGLIMATVAILPVLALTYAFTYHRTGRLTPLQIFTAVAVIFFTAMTVLFNDERFLKMKTTIAYTIFAALISIGLLRKKLYLRALLKDFIAMEKPGWWRLSVGLVIGFVVLAISNEIVWRTQSTEIWAFIETFIFPGALAVYLTILISSLSKYHIEDD